MLQNSVSSERWPTTDLHPIMHHGGDVIGREQIHARHFVEVVHRSWPDVVPQHDDVVVAVPACMLVPQTNQMADFVCNHFRLREIFARFLKKPNGYLTV